MERNELLLAITRCPEIERARGDAGHPCHLVVCFQDAAGYHVPEPWQGISRRRLSCSYPSIPATEKIRFSPRRSGPMRTP